MPVARGSVESDAGFPPSPWENHTARFSAHWAPSAAVITAQGELDASNSTALADFVQRCAAHSKRLVLDLSGLEFFGTSGFAALHAINVRCAAADVRWAVIPGRAVSRLLRICDPDHTLPLTELPEAVPSPYEESRRLLELVSQSR